MKTPLYLFGAGLLTAAVIAPGLGQRPRNVSTDSKDQPATVSRPAVPTPAPVKAKYEGGFTGYNKKEDGFLTFDDGSSRLVFRDKVNKERISIPYDSITAVFPDTKSLRPGAASVISAIPTIYTLPAQFIRKKYRYITIQHRDPDNGVAGVTSFKLENKETLTSEVDAVAQKAGLSQRGDGYVRKSPAPAAQTPSDISSAETVSAGILNSRAVALPRPSYPEAARQSRVAGTVSVQVTVDETGKVVDAKAVSGDPQLQEAAVAAARNARFAPTKVNGRPVRVIGVLNYDFTL